MYVCMCACVYMYVTLQPAAQGVPGMLPRHRELPEGRQSQERELPCQVHRLLPDTGECECVR